jgi:hypothetical protein
VALGVACLVLHCICHNDPAGVFAGSQRPSLQPKDTHARRLTTTYCAVLCCAVLCCAVLCCAVLCCVTCRCHGPQCAALTLQCWSALRGPASRATSERIQPSLRNASPREYSTAQALQQQPARVQHRAWQLAGVRVGWQECLQQLWLCWRCNRQHWCRRKQVVQS